LEILYHCFCQWAGDLIGQSQSQVASTHLVMSEKSPEHQPEGPETSDNFPTTTRRSSDDPVSSSPTIHDNDVDVERGPGENGKEAATDHEIVDWDGPNDPDHPQQWSLPLKLYIGFILTIITMIVSINSSIYNTGAEQEEKEFGMSQELNTLGTSLFLVVRLIIALFSKA
jgi:hypothetical protein